MYLVRNGKIQFYCNDDKYDVMNALGYELYKIEEIPANDAAKNADCTNAKIENKSESMTSEGQEVVCHAEI